MTKAAVATEAMHKYAVFTSSSRTPTPLLCPVTSKVSFRSPAAAQKHHDHLPNRVGARPQIPYKCADCPYYHLTSGTLTRRKPDHVHAFRAFLALVSQTRSAVRSRSASEEDVDEIVQRTIEADRQLRLFTEVSVDAESVRAGLRAAMVSKDVHNVEAAKRLAEELVPLGMHSESWVWVTVARDLLIDAIDEATETGTLDRLPAARDRYLACVDAHLDSAEVDRSEFCLSEFKMVSDITALWVEWGAFDEANQMVLDTLFAIEERASL